MDGLRVLVVEDFNVLAMEMEWLLTRLGCVVCGPAASVEAALAELERGPIDAALLDVDLSGTPVTPVARRLKALGVPFVLTSGYEASSLPPELRGEALLQKPLAPDAVASAVRLMAQRRSPVQVPSGGARGSGVQGAAEGGMEGGVRGISGSPNEPR